MPADGPTPGQAETPGRTCLFLNNYRGGGIGDFGAELLAHLPEAGIQAELEETRADGAGIALQLRRVRKAPDPVITNVGLTAWGPSGPRNFLGFRAIGKRARSGRPTVSIIHHAIEMFELSETGYRVSRLVRWGAHRALAAIRASEIVVFSPRLRDLLLTSYGATSVWLTPMPCAEPRSSGPVDGPGTVVTAGYLAPYKGVDVFLDVAEKLRGSAGFALVGRPHSVLSQEPEFAARARRWLERAQSLGVATPGYLPRESLDHALSNRAIGLLPYSSSSGASASFGLFAERGVPVIASDLPEFRYLASEGAGVVITEGRTEAVTRATRELLSSPSRWEALAERQRAFARANSWGRFVLELRRRYPALAPSA